MRYTCSLDLVEDFPDGAPDHVIAQALGVHEQLVDAEVRVAVIKHRAEMRRAGLLDDDEERGHAWEDVDEDRVIEVDERGHIRLSGTYPFSPRRGQRG